MDDGRACVRLRIEDTGIGIPPDKLESIFDSFRQADDSTTRRYGGTGLGTTIARDLVQLMGGRITVESEVDKGTCFTLWLPLLGQDCPTPARAPATPFKGVRVLIYERNQTLRELILEVCRDLGMTSFAEHDIGRLAEAVQRAGGIDLLIVADTPERLDLAGTVATYRRLLNAQMPCLLLIYGQRRSELGDDDRACLAKPFLREDLVAAIGLALADQPEAAPCVSRVEPEPQTRPTVEARVLVAEDNAIAAQVITKLLERQGCSVTLVPDGNEALRTAQRESFDLAFIDLHMPSLDGIGFTRRLRAAESPGEHLNIIALTANAAEDIKEKCLAAGMDHFLTKPVDPSALADAVFRYGSRAR
jgi:two-component system sensor histidine kinase RpfC